MVKLDIRGVLVKFWFAASKLNVLAISELQPVLALIAGVSISRPSLSPCSESTHEFFKQIAL